MVLKIKLFKLIAVVLFISLNFTLLSQESINQELRAVWITTAFNIDWPSSANLDSYQQQQEFIDIIQKHKENGINAVFVQIRPSAEVFYDALHKSN